MNKIQHRLPKSLLLALLSFIAVLVLFQFLYQTDNKYNAGPPYGEKGHFAFSEMDLQQARPLFLIDGWEFYADRRIIPGELQPDNPINPEFVFIGQYPNFSFLSARHSPYGDATYRMLLDYSGPPQVLTLEIPEIFTDYTLWINGQEVHPAAGSISFFAEAENELLLAVTNQSHYYSGLIYPPALGLPQTISRMLLLRNLFYGLICVFPLALCFYAVAAFVSRRQDLRLLHFGLLCFFFGLHCAHPFIHQLGLSGKLWYAIEDTSWLAVLYEAIALGSIQAGLSDKIWYRRWLRPFCIFLCFFSSFSIFFILPEFGALIKPYGNLLDFYKLLCWLYLLFCAVWGLYKKLLGSDLILSGTAILGASLVINLLDNNHFEPIYTGWQTEYAGFLLVFVFWALIVQHTRELLNQNRQLTLHLEEAVQQRTTELNMVLQERKAFFSDLAHNLKAPMAAIQGFTSLILRENVYLDSELKENLSKIDLANTELSRRMQVLGELNAFDKLTEQSVLLNIDELLTQVYVDNAPEASISGILLLVEKLNQPVAILAPRTKTLLIFENLIYNAFSFTPEDGSITIQPKLEGNEIVITVSDTGVGISPEHLPHLFERFYVGREDRSAGSGLGLYIVRLTVTELGGSISVQSTPGQGTNFTLRFPAHHSLPDTSSTNV